MATPEIWSLSQRVFPITSTRAFKDSPNFCAVEHVARVFCHDDVSIGIESESRVKWKKSIVRRHIIPLLDGPGMKDPPFRVLTEAALC